MNKMKSILFLSALDFKEKSIQVIRKTPEAFAANDWIVHYIVSRDSSKYGTYFYEQVINPDNINVYRFKMPLTGLRNILPNNILQVAATKLAIYLTTLKLAYKAAWKLKTNEYDVIYGYELHGVLAIRILKLFGLIRKPRTVSRFQGTWITKYLKNRQYLKLLLNWDAICAMRFKSDLCIMTNDGTQGDLYFERRQHIQNFHFWINGVDNQIVSESAYREIKNKHKKGNNFLFVSVCRLETWKRVDRIIKTISQLVNNLEFTNFKYLVIGDGPEKQNLIDLAEKEKISSFIEFLGAVSQDEVKLYLSAADIFFSTNDLSNVGNPLLEAIRANKIIFTLNNGDTAEWIKHKNNGFIYEINDKLYMNMAIDVINVLNDSVLRETIIMNIKVTEQDKLWNWKERFEAELAEVDKLLDINK